MKIFRIIGACLATLCYLNLSAQSYEEYEFEQEHETYQVSLLVTGGATLGDFKDIAGGSVVGTGFNALFNPKGKREYSPIFVGLEFSYVTFGRDKQAENADYPALKTTFNDYSISGAARFFPTQNKTGFTPFLDGLLGLKILNTRTKVDKDLFDTLFSDDAPEVIHTTSNTGLGYGLGGGFYTRKALNDNGNRDVSFTFRIMYTWGDKTSFVKRDSLKVDINNGVTYETAYVNTNMIVFQLGILIN
ncbi:MAG: hypothetical protein KF687_13840 [Cyclobacteriaceae bacterium]|nr:hypothetical protein [Cyclobacteriaceae bacterium]